MTSSTPDDKEACVDPATAGPPDSAVAAGSLPGSQTNTATVRSRTGRKSVWIYILHVLFILIASVLVFLPGLVHCGLMDPSEGFCAEVSREMLECSSWVTPLFNYKPDYEQPVLIYWMIIASFKLAEAIEILAAQSTATLTHVPLEFFARLPVALCGALSGLALLFFTRPLLRTRAAFFSALALISTPLFVASSRIAIPDVPLTLFMMLGGLGLFSRIHGAHWITLAIAYIGLGLSALLAGPAPVILIAGIVLAYLALIRPKDAAHQWWYHKSILLHPLLGLAVMLSIAAPWYLAEVLATKGQFFGEFFFGASTHIPNSLDPLWHFVPISLAGFLPWWILNMFSIRRYIALLKTPQVATRRANLELFSLIWLSVVILSSVIFSSKMSNYLVTAAPALAILSGSLLDRIVRFRRTKRLALLLLLFSGIVMPLFVVFAPPLCFRLGIDGTNLVTIMGFAFFVWCFFVFAAISAFFKNGEASVTAVACACAFACGTFVPTGLQIHYLQNDRPLFLLLQRVVRDRADVALYAKDSPAANFYLRRPLKLIKTLPECNQYAAAGKRRHYLLVTTEAVDKMSELPALWTLIEKRANWQLFSVDPGQ